MHKIGNRIKEIRKDNNLTQAQFGEKIGLKDSAVSMLERNDRSLTESVIKNIVTQFCVNQLWLRDGIGEKYNQELLDNKKFLDCMSNLPNPALINKHLELFDKAKCLGVQEQEDLLHVLDRLYSILSISEINGDIGEYIKLLRLDLIKFIKLFVSDRDANLTLDVQPDTGIILTDEEEELLNIYTKLDPKDREEVLSFLYFKNSTKTASKKKQKLSTCTHNEEAATIQSNIG